MISRIGLVRWIGRWGGRHRDRHRTSSTLFLLFHHGDRHLLLVIERDNVKDVFPCTGATSSPPQRMGTAESTDGMCWIQVGFFGTGSRVRRVGGWFGWRRRRRCIPTSTTTTTTGTTTSTTVTSYGRRHWEARDARTDRSYRLSSHDVRRSQGGGTGDPQVVMRRVVVLVGPTTTTTTSFGGAGSTSRRRRRHRLFVRNGRRSI